MFTPTLFNTLRFGFNRVYADTTKGKSNINPAVADPALSAIPGQQAGELSVGGISSFGGATGRSRSAQITSYFAMNTFEVLIRLAIGRIHAKVEITSARADRF